jgi:NADPH:quinone reductase
MMTDLPQTMRVIEIREPGAAEVLRMGHRPLPEIQAGEVLIQVFAAGINRPDVLQRMGIYPPPKGASDLLGLEVAGRIVQIGEQVQGWHRREAVCALTNGGGYAEYCAVPAGQCLPIPKGLSFIEAASLPETYFTVWSNLFDRAHLRPGETLLVQGGSSGIGVTAIQLGRAFGNIVYATSGTDEKCRVIEQLGAARAINYQTQDFDEEIRRLTGGRGVDVILDIIAGEYAPREMKILADDGRLVLIAVLGGTKATINLASILMRRLAITGSTLRPQSTEYKTAIAIELHEKVWPLFEQRKIRPVIYAAFPLAEAALAHALMESRKHIGKIVLKVTDDAEQVPA